MSRNPLAVVEGADDLTDLQMRRIAGEFNQAETTFVMRSDRADLKLRSLTAIGSEVVGAGHNALGAWLWLAERGKLGELGAPRTFHQEIGGAVLPIVLQAKAGRIFGRMKQSPLKLLAQLDGVEALARALALEPGAILTTPPPRTADTGANHLLVRLADAATVERGAPDAPALLEVQRGVDAEGGAAEKKANALQKPLTPSADLAAVVRSGQLSRGETVAKIWDDIKANNLQNPANKREILADAKLKAVFDGNDKVSMFEMNKHLARRLK